MSKQELDLSFLDDSPQPDVSVNLDFLTEPGTDPNQAWRDLQKARFPTNEESGRGAPGTPVDSGVMPVSDAMRAALPFANPAALWDSKVRDAFGRMTKTAVSDVAGAAMMVPRALFSPRKTAEALGAQRERGETRVGQAWQQGDYPYALSRGLLNMVPFGPGMGEVLDESGVDPAKGVGHVVGMGITPKVLGDLTRGIKAVPGVVSDAAKYGVKNAAIDVLNKNLTPAQQYFKALRPLNSKLGFDKSVNVAMPELKAAADSAGLKIEDIQSLDLAHDLAMNDLIAKQRALMGDRPVIISGKPIAAAIKKAIPDLFRQENPEAAASIEEWADKTYDRDFTHEQLNQFRKDANAANAGYYGKLPQGQMAMDRKVDSAIKVAKGNAIRNTLYDGLETDSGTGDALRTVNQRIKALMDSQEILDRRYNVEQRQALQNLPQQIGKLAAFGKFGRAAKMLIQNPSLAGVGAAGVDVLTGMGEIELTNLLRETNSTNGQIASAFRRMTNEPTAIPISPVSRYQRAIGPAGAGDVLPSTETGSASPASASAQSQWQRPSAIQLPQQDASTAPPDPQTAWRTAFSRWFGAPQEGAESAAETADKANTQKFIMQEGDRGRLGLQTTGPQPQSQPPDIDVDFTPIDTHMPASPVEPQRALPVGSGQEAGRPVTEMPGEVKPWTSRDFLNLETAEHYVARDPATGRMRRVYKGTGTGESVPPVRDPKTGRFQKRTVRDSGQKGAAWVGGDGVIDAAEAKRLTQRFGVSFAGKEANPDGSYNMSAAELKKINFKLKQQHVADLLSGKAGGKKTTYMMNEPGDSPRLDKLMDNGPDEEWFKNIFKKDK